MSAGAASASAEPRTRAICRSSNSSGSFKALTRAGPRALGPRMVRNACVESSSKAGSSRDSISTGTAARAIGHILPRVRTINCCRSIAPA